MVVILQSFALYCVDASFISCRAIDCTNFESAVSGFFRADFSFQVACVICDFLFHNCFVFHTNFTNI